MDAHSGVNVTYSDIYGNAAGDIGQPTYTTLGAGYISIDPQFAGEGDWHLQAGSPCVDAGTGAGAPSDDIEGNTRPHDDGYDMGSYELSY